MNKKFVGFLMLLFIVVFSVSMVFAEGNARKGKRIWKVGCRLTCHDGSVQGSPALSPVSKTQAQWKTWFANDHAKINEIHKKGELDKARVRGGAQGWEDMFQYLHDHALDSAQPETCG